MGTKKSSAKKLAETIAAVEVEIDTLEGLLRDAESEAVDAAINDTAYAEAEAKVTRLQEQLAEKRQRHTRLQAACRAAESEERNKAIHQLRVSILRQQNAFTKLGAETEAARNEELARHKKAMDEFNTKLSTARRNLETTRRELEAALQEKAKTMPDDINRLIALRADARLRAESIAKELSSTEEAIAVAETVYQNAIDNHEDEGVLQGHKSRIEAKKQAVQELTARKDQTTEDINKLTDALRDVGADPDHTGVEYVRVA